MSNDARTDVGKLWVTIAERDARIAELEAENARLRDTHDWECPTGGKRVAELEVLLKEERDMNLFPWRRRCQCHRDGTLGEQR